MKSHSSMLGSVINIPIKILLFVILLTFLFNFAFVGTSIAQSPSPNNLETKNSISTSPLPDNKFAPAKPIPSATGKFRNPDGPPPFVHKVDEKTGRFENPQAAPRLDNQLMDPNTTYPPPEVKRALLIILIIAAIAFYFVFLRGRVVRFALALVSVPGAILSRARQNSEDEGSVFVSSRIEEKVSNESIIRDMYEELTKEKAKEKTRFRNFSFRQALPPLPPTETLGIDRGEAGIHILLCDSPELSRAIALNLVASTARAEHPLLFFSSRISSEELATGVIAIECKKTWSKMEEHERYRISRQVEDFMEKYSGIHTARNCKLDKKTIENLLAKVGTESKPTAIIIEDYSFLVSQTGENILESLDLISRKEAIPVFIIDRSSLRSQWEKKLYVRPKSFLDFVSKSGEKIRVNDILNKRETIRSLIYNREDGRLINV